MAAFLQKASSSEQSSNTLSSSNTVNQPGQSSLLSQQIVPQIQQNVAPRAQTYDFNQYAKEASESIKAAVGVSFVMLHSPMCFIAFFMHVRYTVFDLL